jgi:circadian clock protein KaiC
MHQPIPLTKISTGIPGLDDILGGGLSPNRVYLLEGAPGTGKTSAGLAFLFAGRERKESTLYVTLSETAEELRTVCESHGWSLDGVDLFELSSADEALSVDREQTLLHPWEAELGETIRLITAEVDRVKPKRVVFDSLSELRLLSQDPLRYRRQVLVLKQYFNGRNITVLLVDDLTGNEGQRDGHLHSLCHGVITLERVTLDFGSARRRLQVQKMRGTAFRGGFHDFEIRTGKIDVFPRLVAAEHHKAFAGDPTSSGISELDSMLVGGPLRGTCTLVTGPPGTGKTSLALQYINAACARGEHCVVYEFDERIGTMMVRSKALGFDLAPHLKSGRLEIKQIDPAEISPGEFASQVRDQLESKKARLVLIDSIRGYLTAMPQENMLLLQLHELLAFLNQQGVTTILIDPQMGLMSGMPGGSLNVSFVADAVILLRYFEAQGRVRKAISVLKNRGGHHEDTIREFRIDAQGLRIGEPLIDFQGIFSGTPTYSGAKGPLMEARPDAKR